MLPSPNLRAAPPFAGWLLAFACAALPAATTPAPAATRPPATPVARDGFRLEDALALTSYSELTWSPDGRRLAFVADTPDTAANTNNADLWIVDAAGGAARRLTRHAASDVSPAFSPGGDTLAFVSTRSTGEEARPAIFMLPLAGGEPWAVGAFDQAVGEVRWSPDGRWLAFTKTDTLPRRVREWRRRGWDHVVEDERLQFPNLWVLEIATGRQRALTTGANYLWYVRWSPDSKRLAFLWSPTGKPDDANQQDIGVVAVEGGAMRRLGAIGTAFAWSPDSRSIAWAAGSDRANQIEASHLHVARVDGGAPVDVTPAFDLEADTPCWNASSDTLFFHVGRGVTTVVAAVPARGGPVALSLDRRAEAGALFAGRGGRVAWVQSFPAVPPEIWIADHPALPGRAVTDLNAFAARRSYGTAEAVRWTSTDGTPVEAMVLRPPHAPPRAALPTLVMLHGGPYGARHALGFEQLPQFFAANGYQVFMPNFRSSGGYGARFMVRERGDWGGQDWRDVTSGLDALIARGLADSTRLGLFGRSYGGYLTAWGITQTRRFDAAAVFAGAVDLGAFYGQSDVQKYRAYEFGGYPWVTPERWARSSPLTHIGNARTPTLIQVGENDRRVPAAQALELYRALLGVGVPVEYVHYPREGHTLREPRHRADHMQRMLAWWRRWIR